jgi:Flp pilus assembly protein TadD
MASRSSIPLRSLVAVALACALLASGCASFQAARLYRSANQDLDGGRPEAAISKLERASALAPQASELQNHLGLAYRAAGRPDEARTAFRRAVEIDCRNDAAQHTLRLPLSEAGPGALASEEAGR